MISKLRNPKGFTLIELMVVVAIIGIILAIAIPYFISYKRSTCDKAANADAAKLSVALERFGQELIDLNCAFEIATIGTSLNLNYVVGPFYGWSGTNVKCDVRVAKVNTAAAGDFNWEAWGCALKGSKPMDDPDVRYIYRYPLFGGKDRPAVWGLCQDAALAVAAVGPAGMANLPAPTNGDCTWTEYGVDCYTSSMVVVGNPCTIGVPDGGITPCRDLTAAD